MPMIQYTQRSKPHACLATCVAMALGTLIGGITTASADKLVASDAAEITAVIKRTWEKPGAPIRVAPVSIAATYAVAGWIEGSRGGRALLKKGAAWAVILCSGDGIRTADGLRAAGVPGDVATTLEQNITVNEAAMPVDDVAKFSMFEGSVPVEGGTHPHQHTH